MPEINGVIVTPLKKIVDERGMIMHMLKRTDYLNTGDQLAIGQEYREWIKCIKNKDLAPQNILFINTSTFGKNNQ